MLTLCIVRHQWTWEIKRVIQDAALINLCFLLCFLFHRVERKERARLKTVKFNAKPGVIDAKGVRK